VCVSSCVAKGRRYEFRVLPLSKEVRADDTAFEESSVALLRPPSTLASSPPPPVAVTASSCAAGISTRLPGDTGGEEVIEMIAEVALGQKTDSELESVPDPIQVEFDRRIVLPVAKLGQTRVMEFEVDGLSPATLYWVRIRARTRVGEGAASRSCAFKTTPAPPAGSVARLQAEFLHDAVCGQMRGNTTMLWRHEAMALTRLLVERLGRSCQTIGRRKGINATGEGATVVAWGGLVAGSSAEPSEALRMLQAYDASVGHLHGASSRAALPRRVGVLRWDAGSSLLRGARVDGYQVELGLTSPRGSAQDAERSAGGIGMICCGNTLAYSGELATGKVIIDCGPFPCLYVSGFAPGDRASGRVRCTTSAGPGDWSSIVSIAAPCLPPSAPQGLHVAVEPPTSLRVALTEPAFDGGDIPNMFLIELRVATDVSAPSSESESRGAAADPGDLFIMAQSFLAGAASSIRRIAAHGGEFELPIGSASITSEDHTCKMAVLPNHVEAMQRGVGISGLSPDTRYAIRAVAVNQAGVGALSEWVYSATAKVPALPPGTPG